MPQKDSVHQALTHLDRVNQLITTLRQLGDNEVAICASQQRFAIAAVCRDKLAYLSNTLTPTLLVRTVNRYCGVIEELIRLNRTSVLSQMIRDRWNSKFRYFEKDKAATGTKNKTPSLKGFQAERSFYLSQQK